MQKTMLACVGLLCILSVSGCDVTQGQLVRDPPRQSAGHVHRLPPEVQDQRSAEQLLLEAREWQRKAASVDGEWRDVPVLMQQAEQALARGDYQAAIDRAAQARFQAEKGYRQMKAQEKVSNPAYLHF